MEFFSGQPLLAGISSRADGSCRLNSAEPDSMHNREKFFKKTGLRPDRIAAAHLVHGRRVQYAGHSGGFADTDGLVTDRLDIYLSITVADCLPVFLYEPGRKAIGLLHAGWRGLRAGILGEGVAAMRQLGAAPEKIRAAIGPSIGPCHFEVRADVLQVFADYPAAIRRRDGLTFLDLRRIAREMLLAGGLRAGNIAAEPPCTACSPEYFSFRRDKPARLEAMAAFIGRH